MPGARRALALVALAALGAARGANAAPMSPTTEPVAVVGLEADTANEHAAKTLTNVLRGQVLDSAEYTLSGQSHPLLATAYQNKCVLRSLRTPLTDASDLAFDAACLKRIAAHLGVKRYFWGYLYTEGGKPYARVHFWQEGQADRALTLPYEEDRRLLAGERLYRKLAIPEKVGDVTVFGALRRAGDLYVDGEARGPYVPSSELTLLEGEHALEVREGATVLADARVRVVAGRRSVIQLLPRDEAPAASARPPAAPPAPVEPPARSGARTTWGWVAVGAGAASLGAGVVSTLRAAAIRDDFARDPALVAYRQGAPGEVCAAADASEASPRSGAASPERVSTLCSGGATARALQYVFYGAGAALVGAGAYVLLASPSATPTRMGAREAPARWQWSPELGPSRAALALRVTF
ncbi:MAG TPA: hypothetical protein VFS43_16170 [Polyangiaceae bacterium]|nr:hypothetical protein [Polyangiaceae bacterium]